MTEQEYAKIIARNIRRLAFNKGKTQLEMAKELGINQSTLSCWMNGTRTPKMSKIDMLCNYFNCKREDLMEDHGGNVTFGEMLKALTHKEVQLLDAYNAAPDSVKEAILLLLGLKERE